MAASPGLEPRLTESESAVLPLDDEAFIFATSTLLSLNFRFVKYFYKICKYKQFVITNLINSRYFIYYFAFL